MTCGISEVAILSAGNNREFRGPDFLVRVIPGFREIVSILYSRGGDDLKLDGEYILVKGHAGIDVVITAAVERALATQVARDLESAFVGMGYGYVIRRDAGSDSVPEAKRWNALQELGELGITAQPSPEGKVTLSRSADAPQQDAEALRQRAARVPALLLDVYGVRERWEILAKSKDL